MPYLGQTPTNGFHTKQTLTGDGSTVTFTLNHTVGNESSIIVSVDGTILEPKHGYDLAGGGSQITFATAPASNVRTYVHFLGQAVVNNLLDMNGAEFVLDEDADTSLTADTDDEIDIKIAGSDRSTIKTTGFHNLDSVKFVAGTGDDMQMYHDGSNSYLTNSTGALKLATETSGIAITIGHTTSEVTVADNLTVGGDLTVTGTTSFNDTNITNVGSIALDTITNDGTDITLDSSGDIILDAGGNDLIFKDSGTEIGRFANSSSDLVIKSAISDQDLILKGNDGGSEISALTFDMSAAGKATFNDQVVIGDGKLVLGSTAVTSTAAELNLLDGVSGLVQADFTKLAGVDSTAAELNIIDGDTSATSTTLADADRVVVNDAGTMVQVALTDFETYFESALDTLSNVTTVGALDSGSITSGFGNIDNGTSSVTTGLLTVDDISVNAKTITMTGSSSDTAVFTAGTDGTLSIVTTDAAGAAANIQITADGTAELAGTTVTLDSSGGITLDADGGTITFADGGSSLGTITSSGYSGTAAVATTVTITDNENTNENNAIVFTAGGDTDGGNLGLESDGDLTYNPSTGTLNVTNIVTSGTHTVTNSVTMNANNAVVFEGATADAYETTLSSVDATADRTINLPNQSGTLPVLAAASATQVTSTPEELNLLDGSSANTVVNSKAVIYGSSGELAGTLSTAAQTNITSVGTLGALTVDNMAFDGNTLTTTSSDFTIDASHDIILDADGGDIKFNDGGTTVGKVTVSATDFVFDATVQDRDIIFKGDDGGSAVTALTLDMSAAGAATFNGAITGGGLLTTGGNIVIPDTGNIGSASDTDAISIAANGETSFTSGIKLADSKKIKLGSGEDLEIYHDGSNSYIADVDTGGLRVLSSYFNVRNAANNESMITATENGAVELYYDDSKKLETTSTGVSVSGYLFGPTNIGLDSTDKIQFSDGANINFVVNGGDEMRLLADGTLHVDGDIIAYSSTISDERLKENIQPIEGALSKVGQLRGMTFTYTPDGKESAGLIAQDVEKVLPSAVTEIELPLKQDDGEKYKVLQYDQTIGLLVEAIKELTAKVEELENK